MGKERGYSQRVDGLTALLRVNATPPSGPQHTSGPQHKGNRFTAGTAFDCYQAILTAAANKVAETLMYEGVRLEKVAAIQSALAAGTYSVPAAAVASKLIDAMLGGGC